MQLAHGVLQWFRHVDFFFPLTGDFALQPFDRVRLSCYQPVKPGGLEQGSRIQH
jgi:hypothetical protein